MASLGRSLRIPPGAAGLVAALDARENGDGIPMDVWAGTGFPGLVAALRDWLADEDAARELACEVVDRLWRAVKRGIVVRCELGLIARTARNARIDAWRARRSLQRKDAKIASKIASMIRSSRPGRVDDPGGVPDPDPLPDPDAVFLLPPPYREAVCARIIDGWSRSEVMRFLQAWWCVGRAGAKWILGEAIKMLTAAVAGEDPRLLWPRRYTRKAIVDKSRKPHPPRNSCVIGGAGVVRTTPEPGGGAHGPEAEGTEAA